MQLTEQEVEAILGEMRERGGTAWRGGSRCNTTYSFSEGRYRRADFDEGHVEEFAIAEDEVRRAIAGEPQAFLPLLRAPHHRLLRAALAAGDRGAARAHLRASLAWGDRLDQGAVLDAFLAWPEARPTPEVVALAREKLSSFTAWHVWMDATGWDRSPENGRRGVAFVDGLVELAGRAPGWSQARASFHELAGDPAAALADLEAEVAEAAARGAEAPEHVRERLARLRAKGGA